MVSFSQDTRLVQTAVIGHKNSEQPIILPMDPDDLAVHRRRHPRYRYWCGIQLGGCGRQLSDRLCRDGRVCHFAHHPDPDGSRLVCLRTHNGEDSADHLFIKQGVTHWLDKQQLPGRAQLRNLGGGPGDALDIHVPGTRQRIRFHLSRGLDFPAWQKADDELGEDVDTVDWVFHHDGPLTREMLGRHGYCLRVRCETDGAQRRVHIGVEGTDRRIDWTPLEECTLTPGGLLTPAVETVRLSRPKPKPAGFLVVGGPTFAVSSQEPVTDAPDHLSQDGRYCILADVKPSESRTVKALLSLPDDVPPPAPGNVFRFTGPVRLLVTEPDTTTDAQWALQGDKFIRLDAHEAQRTGLWSPATAVVVEVPKPSEAPVVPAPQPTVPDPEPVTAAPLVVAAELRDAATRVREALLLDAGRSATTTWQRLARAAGLDLDRLATADRIELLVKADLMPGRGHPYLSVLVRQPGGGPLPYLPEVLEELGLGRAEHGEALRRWCAQERIRAFARYGSSPREVPPRLPFPAVAAKVRKATGTATVAHVRALLIHAKQVLPEVEGAKGRGLRRIVAQAEEWERKVRVGGSQSGRVNGAPDSRPAQYYADALIRHITWAQERSGKG
ncbi:hypothetical protein ACFY3J_22610 [Streptomyces sp. NPDC001231]|uniref:hypothetical protein n=1 Tax=Streptomyces sp. NPDC001231 TaxID=3364549 RepID=UPI0036765FDF